MHDALSKFQNIVSQSHKFTEARTQPAGGLHPFDERNIHPEVEKVSKKLFDDGHYPQSTFEAYKYIDKKVQKLSKSKESGCKLMMQAFSETSPLIMLTPLSTTSSTPTISLPYHIITSTTPKTATSDNIVAAH